MNLLADSGLRGVEWGQARHRAVSSSRMTAMGDKKPKPAKPGTSTTKK
ncbi:hypothetical protein [Pseudooceanicola onchidii]|nr:hypothetical protein [Pseudooceanicola onchidii]